ncbi:TlpA family protein disulfide reductase [Bailinhaonella thermotolerans]|uniref:TlpA family protein disulfide reductase n=1 Tax=Bailinhaonella thermotolerans TaxID=1070861 RepID=A0A3A4B0J1_9ACTN|nr:TlpA disulfide reductase family protein [Bailinhaonella thermotolerans]RJL33448.1 TlpA family protein disulfide reductase [Bailinhaonella thermotolerans]
MFVLVAAVVLLTVVCLLNLALTVGVIRRLREHSSFIDTVAPVAISPPVTVEPGEKPADFAVTTEDGEPFSRDLIAAPTLIGFFSPTCAPCAELLPDFIDQAAAMPGGRGQVLAVIAAKGRESAAEYAARLSGVARVVIEEHDGTVQRAFKTENFPTVYLVDSGGTVISGGVGRGELTRAAEALAAHGR